MISIERALLGAGFSGDALERHKEYGQRAGHLDVILLTTKKPQSSDGVKRFEKRKVNSHLTIYPTNSRTKLNYVFDAFRIARTVAWSNKFDLIVCQDPFLNGLAGWLIKKWSKVPLLVHFHGDFWQNKHWLFEKGRWWFNWFFLLISKFVVKRADGIRVTSSGIKDKLATNGIKRKKIRIISTPIDLEKFESSDEKKVKSFREKHRNKKVLISVGRKDPSKDFKTLYKAIELIYQDYKNLAFWQVGNKEYLPGKIGADKNLVLTSTGEIKLEELPDYYHASDIYISSSKHESFGKVLVEAMAAGLPVVATKTTGSKEIVKDGKNGYLVNISDSVALAKKVLFLLNNPDKAEKMGQAGKKMVREEFSQEKIIRKIIKFWKELI